jgi:hypothetical protein
MLTPVTKAYVGMTEGLFFQLLISVIGQATNGVWFVISAASSIMSILRLFWRQTSIKRSRTDRVTVGNFSVSW